MIYMGIVYHYIYAIFRADPKKFNLVLIGFHDFLEGRNVKDFENLSWHNFSLINESHIFQFYRAVGLSKDEIKELKNPVTQRNEILHTNGTYLSSEEAFEKNSERYLKNLEKIHSFCEGRYLKLYKKFLRSFKLKINEKEEAQEYLRTDFIEEHNVSQKVLESIMKLKKKDYPNNIKVIFDALKIFTNKTIE